ncbi:MAG: hypothetical protein ABIR19_02550 [Ginsengibacter sp.]
MERENSLTKDIEDLVNKSIEANKIFLSEGSRILRRFTVPGEKKAADIFEPNFIQEAFSAYTRLNIQYLQNVMDLGVSMVKKAGAEPVNSTDVKSEPSETSGPSFVLAAEAEAGSKVQLSFLLDNIKNETALCNLVSSPYIFNQGASSEENFVTIFSPQSFSLRTGEQQRITIDITIPDTSRPGEYVSAVKVEGFEAGYFSIHLTIKEQSNKIAPNGRKKAGSRK